MTSSLLYSKRGIAFTFTALIVAALAFHGLIYRSLGAQMDHMSARGFDSARLEFLSQLENELGTVLTEAELYVANDTTITEESLQMALDILWSRVKSGASDQYYDTYVEQGIDVSIIDDFEAALPRFDVAVAALRRGDAASLAQLMDLKYTYWRRISSFSNAAYAARVKRLSAASVEQWRLFESLNQVQYAFVVYGATFLVLLLAAMSWANRTLNRLKARNAENQQLADTDQLTGLRNRASLTRHLQQRVEHGEPVSIIAVDLDRFHAVNDSFGHRVGDKLLSEVGARISDAAKGAVVGRAAGDEFVVVVDGGAESARELADAINQRVRSPVDIGDRLYVPSVSISIAEARPGASVEQLILGGNAAMAAAKALGGGQAITFEDSMLQEIQQRVIIERDLPLAIAQGEVEIVAQPKFDLLSRSVCGYEALARWQHPELGWVSPEQLCRLADSIGRSSALGLAVADQAFALAAAVKPMGEGGRMSINVSPAFGSHPTFVADLTALIEKHRLEPGDVEFEVTEESIMSELGPLRANLAAMRQLGVAIAIDDFGNGSSNVNRLAKLDFSVLKVDKSFVDNLNEARSSRAIIRGLVKLAREINVELLVEGVETEEQATILEELGATHVQGYLLARPMEPLKLIAWLEERRKAAKPPRSIKVVA